MALVLTRRVGETVMVRVPPSTVETLIVAWLSDIKPDRARLAIEAPRHVRIDRQEVAEANGEQSTPEGWTHERPV